MIPKQTVWFPPWRLQLGLGPLSLRRRATSGPSLWRDSPVPHLQHPGDLLFPPARGWGVLVLPRPQQGLGSPWPCSSTSICSWRKLLESKAQAGELSVLPWRPKCRNTDNFEAVWRIYTKKNPFFHMLSCSVVVISVGNPPLFSFLQLLCTRGREALFQILF